jgi:Protein of unknown function (DUF2937)
MSVIYRYFLILIACISILVGIQIPCFVDQYEKRLDAHFLEVTNNLRGYQEIAEKFFNGSIPELIKKHEASEDRTFKEEAQPIKNIYERYLKFKAQKESLNTNMAGKVIFIAVKGDRELINETFANYSFMIPLNKDAVIAGFILAAIMLLILELLKMGIYRLFRSKKHSIAAHYNPRSS